MRSLAAIIGEESLSSIDKDYLKFGEQFEQRFLKQNKQENRTIEQTLGLAWELLAILPEDELTRIHTELLKKYFPKRSSEA